MKYSRLGDTGLIVSRLALGSMTFGTIKDGPFEKWTLTDGALVMDEAVTVNLTVVDEDTMNSVADGATDTRVLKRCD